MRTRIKHFSLNGPTSKKRANTLNSPKEAFMRTSALILRIGLSLFLIFSLFPSIAWGEEETPPTDSSENLSQEPTIENNEDDYRQTSPAEGEEAPLSLLDQDFTDALTGDSDAVSSESYTLSTEETSSDLTLGALALTDRIGGALASMQWNGHTYAAYGSFISYYQADAYCRLLGGHLVTITSQEEQNRVQGFLPIYPNPQTYLIGLKGNGSSWYWSNGEPFYYSNIAANLPQGFFRPYVSMSPHPTKITREVNGEEVGSWLVNPYKWAYWDEPEYLSFIGFICEWDYTQNPTPPTPTLPKPAPVKPPQQTKDEVHLADPIDLSTGAQVMDLNYLDQSVRIPFDLNISYNGSQLVSGVMGPGWFHQYERRIEEVGGNGGEEDFLRYHPTPSTYIDFSVGSSAGSYVTLHKGRTDWTLQELAGGGWTLNCGYDEFLNFNSAGRLVSITNRTGDSLSISYAGNRTVIEDLSTERTLILSHDDNGYLESAQTLFNGVVSASMTFHMNAAGHLDTFVDPSGNSSTFTYDPEGRMLSATDGAGITFLENEYNEMGQVIAQHDGLESPDTSTLTYYDIPGFSMVLVVDREDQHSLFTFDESGLLTTKLCQDGRISTWEYDDQGNVVRETDARGNITLNTYDASGNLLTKRDPNNKKRSWSYDTANNLLRETSPLNEVTTFTYDTANRLVAIKDAEGLITQYTYLESKGSQVKTIKTETRETSFVYDHGLLVSKVSPSGNVTTLTYDDRCNATSLTDGEGNTWFYSYDESGRLVSEINPEGGEALTYYDCRGAVVLEVDPEGGETAYEYNGNGLVCAITSATGGTTAYARDGEGRVTQITDPEGRVTTRVYSSAGLLAREVDALGNVRQYFYDAAGNLVQEELPNTSPVYITNYYTYDACNRLIRKKNAENETTVYEYDSCGRLIKEESPNSRYYYAYDRCSRVISIEDYLGKTNCSYDIFGNLVSIVDAEGRETTYSYDVAGRIVSSTEAGRTLNYNYDMADNLISIEEPGLNKTTTLVYDASKRHTQTIDPIGGEATLSLDGNNNTLSQINPLGGEEYYVYDAVGRVISETTPSSGEILYSYDASGLLQSTTNARGDDISYSYDEAGRLSGRSIVNSSGDNIETVGYSFNAIGFLTEAGNASFSYDNLGRVKSATDGNGYWSMYNYDSAGNLVYLQYDDMARNAQYEYDASGNMINARDWRGEYTYYEYDETGNLVLTQRPNGSYLEQEYDDSGRLISMMDWASDGSLIVGYELTYGPGLEVYYEEVLHDNSARGYSYDSLGRLTQVEEDEGWTGNQKVWEYSYDSAGNITAVTGASVSAGSSGQMTMSYDNNNRLSTVGTSATTHDADGNMTAAVIGGQASNLVYDSLNQLIQTNQISYTYDAVGNRLWKKDASGEKTWYAYDATRPTHLLSSEDSTGTTSHMWGIGLIGTEFTDGSYVTYHFDPRGSTVALTDEYGAIIDRISYTPFGEVILRDNYDIELTFLFNGQYGVMDDGNGLLYMKARYYAPSLMRFVNADILRGSLLETPTLNRYAFANGNPISYIDPLGRSASLITSQIGKNFSDMSPVFMVLGSAAVIDGPLPFGDAVALGGAVILSAGIIVYSAVQSTTITDTQQRKEAQYWKAVYDKETKSLSLGEPLTYSEAMAWISNVSSTSPNGNVEFENGVIARDQSAAYALARNFPGFIGPEVGRGEGYLWHYHQNASRSNGGVHIWFYGKPAS